MRGRPVLLGLAIVGFAIAAYAPLRANGFVRIDDPAYLVDNPHLAHGLSLETVAWALRPGYASNWHPLTWISHAFDVSLWGLDPWPHHATSLLLHLASAVLLYALLLRTTKREGASFFVALVFALHPLHVESVAWASERKDVLSTALGFAALTAWVAWTGRGGAGPYLVALALYALSLSAKPMLVTLPFLLLILDRWPLARRPSRPMLEKVPYFALAAASCWLTVVAQSRGDAIDSLENIPVGFRLGNAAAAYLDYARLALWPSGLAVFYPYPSGGPPAAKIAGGVVLLAIGSVLAIATRKRRPWFLAGWLWWVGTLVPVIGIVQVGGQARADRYMYVPLVGLAIAVVYTIDALVAEARARRTAAAALGGAWIGALSVVTWIQVGVWRSDRTLFEQALRVTKDNYVAHFQLGYDYAHEDRIQESLAQYAACVQLLPDYDRARNDYGAALMVAGRFDDAAREFRESLRCNPMAALVHFNLAGALLRLHRTDEAIASLEKGLELEPSNEARRQQLADLRRGR